ncbi:serine/threonine protein kinase [Fulvivirga imtechensis AK7]|uniref:Serine/threonine protein kinase n=1 Tax=Fulvivirga imtechensis AK7 TaxID=1237149 RepID=L8JMK3_9BACT|nr:SpoIIE family protein phosphatase [Fulvivirga imtechensis]ELR69463.1 serine/threonine protein kinase [Fulvivirga imtechensis AK7]
MKLIYSILFFLTTLSLSFYSTAQNSTQEGIESYKEKLHEAIQTNDLQKAAAYSYEIARLYFKSGELKEAAKELMVTLSYSEKINNSGISQSAYYTLGLIHHDLREYNDAIKQFRKSYKLAEKQKDELAMADNSIGIAQCYAALQRHKRAIEPLEEALSIYIRHSQRESRQYCYNLLAEYHKQLGNGAKSNEYFSHYSLMESESNRERQLSKMEERIGVVEAEKIATERALGIKESELLEQSQELQKVEDSLKEAQELSEKQQLQINLLNTEKELSDMTVKEQNARIQNERLLRNSLIGGVALAGALIFVIFIDYRRKIKTNKKIHQQNLNITSSINYAQRIQQAMLPHLENIGELLPDHFVLFKPRDIVSGDFYWFSELPGDQPGEVSNFGIAAVDCTGHGVPGAFMSMIGMNALNGIVNRGINKTDQILENLHHDITSALRQEETGNRDGMDMALCLIKRNEKILEFSGAKNPLVYIQNNELHHIKGDVHSIGGGKKGKETRFTQHKIKIDQPTTVYIFSDGYVDQFGGLDNMKFMSKRFKQLLYDIHQLPLEEQKARLDKSFYEWKGDGRQIDDILVIGFRIDI